MDALLQQQTLSSSYRFPLHQLPSRASPLSSSSLYSALPARKPHSRKKKETLSLPAVLADDFPRGEDFVAGPVKPSPIDGNGAAKAQPGRDSATNFLRFNDEIGNSTSSSSSSSLSLSSSSSSSSPSLLNSQETAFSATTHCALGVLPPRCR
eukprot:c25183_g2_i1 orf=128-583(+)